MIKGKRVLGITLARGGSKSVYKKNIRILAGKPLIAYTIEAALASSYLDDYIVSTEDKQIAKICEDLGARIPFFRPLELASDTASSADALCHAVDFVEQECGKKFDYIIELMATNPFKTSIQIDSILEKLDETGADSVIAVTRVWDHHPARIKKLDNRGRLVDFCIPETLEARRQDLSPPAFVRCGSIYALSRNYLMKTKTRYGSEDSYAFIIPETESINIDNEIDFALAEIIIKERNSNK